MLAFVPLLILLLLIFMVARQFRERRIQLPAILIFPALVIYYTYINIKPELVKSTVDPALLVAALLVGLIGGVCIGLFRGNLARMRMDTATGIVYAKGNALSLVIWCVLLIARVGAGYLTYTQVGLTVTPLLLLSSVLHTLFLGSICAEAFRLYMRSTRLLSPEQAPVQSVKY